jgi:hypothetical protein
MRRSLALVVLLGVLSACGGEPVPVAQPTTPTTSEPPSSPTPSASPTGSTTPSPSPTASPIVLPPGVPSSYAPDDEPGDVPVDELIPKTADATGTEFPRFPRGEIGIVVTYVRGTNPFAAEHGFVVWRRFARSPHWRATYGFRDAARAGVLGIQVTLGEATGDDLPDALTFESVGGTGNCGGWRLVQLGLALDDQIEPIDSCDAQIEFSTDPVGLLVTESVFKPGDAHCCPSKYRVTQLEWDGEAFSVMSRETHIA